MSAVDLMNMTCTLTQPSWARSTSSSFMVPTYGSGTTGIKCSIQPSSSYQTQMGQRETGITEFDCYFEATTSVDVDYRITAIVGYDGYAGIWANKTLEIRSLFTDGAGRGQYLGARARIVEDGPAT